MFNEFGSSIRKCSSILLKSSSFVYICVTFNVVSNIGLILFVFSMEILFDIICRIQFNTSIVSSSLTVVILNISSIHRMKRHSTQKNIIKLTINHYNHDLSQLVHISC